VNTNVAGTTLFALLAAAVIGLAGVAAPASAQSIKEEDSRAALNTLYASSPRAKQLGETANGILVFPNVSKAGFIIGGQSGDGVLLVQGKTVGYYNTSAVSVGLQAGVQSYAYVLFFMSDEVLKHFSNSNNFEVGVGPSIVVIDAGAAKDVNTLTAKSDVYAMIFDQKGLMAGAGLQGSKITKLK
jgi:lipid-binding SYLF domain-containing protein